VLSSTTKTGKGPEKPAPVWAPTDADLPSVILSTTINPHHPTPHVSPSCLRQTP